MFGVVSMPFSPNRHEISQTVFGGYDHRAAASDGAIYDGWNMCADRYPALTTRARRGQGPSIARPNGFYVRDCVVWVDGDQLVIDGEAVATLTAGKKTIVGIQHKLCIWPDKVIYDRETGELTQMEAQWSGEAAFSDGTLFGESALANTITVSGDLTGIFRAGDGVAVTIAETGMETKTFGAFVIQEISYTDKVGDVVVDETEIRFLDETWREFVEESESEGTDDGMTGFPGVGSKHTVTIQRRTPELEHVFEHHNRIWGVCGNEIKCCKLGDPTNWEVFPGIETDSWSLKLGSPGEVTGGISYGGRPMFFKERLILTIYGDTPQTYSLSQQEDLGVESGSGGSLAVAGQVLYYKSPAGVMAYSGGYPRSIAEAFGEDKYRYAVAGSDGVKYYISMEGYSGSRDLFVYDTRHQVWHKESGTFRVFGWNGELVALNHPDPSSENSAGAIEILGSPRKQTYGEEGISTRVEFADFTDSATRKKAFAKLILRLEADAGTTLKIWVRYDSRGEWEQIGQDIKGGMVKGQIDVPVYIRRCDHYRIRIDGQGQGGSGWTLHALTRDRSVGSNRK